jgi:NAD(P)-dependent dehydrogenase (short-subunit alcohol dehydrogenase family)
VPKLLDSRGCFVAVSSSAVRKPFAGAAGYLTAKAGLITLIESLDADYGSRGLRANVLLPGTIDTPANRAAMPDAKTTTWVQPDDFAQAMAVLLRSPAIRGATIPLAGSA